MRADSGATSNPDSTAASVISAPTPPDSVTMAARAPGEGRWVRKMRATSTISVSDPTRHTPYRSKSAL